MVKFADSKLTRDRKAREKLEDNIQRAVDAYTHVLDREATDLLKNLFLASQGGILPVNPQVRLDAFVIAPLVDSELVDL